MAIKILTALCLTATMLASQTAAPVPNGVILGKVIDAVSKAPIEGVLVEVRSSAGTLAPGATPPPPVRSLTDAQGRFVFRQLLPGSYVLSATTGSNGFEQSGFLVTGMGHLIAPYLNGGYGQRRPNGPMQDLRLEQGAVVSDAVIALWKGASINGTVVDEAGEPLVDMIVAAVRHTTDGIITTGPTTRTDDRGYFHVSALPPGDYVIVVPQTQVLLPLSASEAAFAPSPDPLLGRQFTAAGAPSPSVIGVTVGNVVSASTPPAAANAVLLPGTRERYLYQSTFHPASTTLDQATVISVRSGDEVNGADVQLKPVPVVSVTGRLMDAGVPVPHFGVRLLPAETGDGSDVMDLAFTATDTRGVFTFPMVPAGEYRLFAQRQTGVPNGTTPQGGLTFAEPRTIAETSGAWAEGTVAVADRPVEDVTLTLRDGYRVMGRVVFEGQSAQPLADRLSQFMITAVPARPQRRHTPSVSGGVIEAGRLTIPRLPPGRYILKWPESLPGWSVESVKIGARDVTDGAFDITDGDVPNVVITFTDQPASLGGVVRSAAALADPEASVFLFPTDRTRWRDAAATPRVVRTVRADATGSFVFPNLIPGEYFVVAVADALAHDWPDQKLLERLSPAAATVHVLPRQRTSVPLSTVEVR